MDIKDIEMTYISGTVKTTVDSMPVCGLYWGKNDLTKDKDVKQQCVMLVKDMAHMYATHAICSIFIL